MWNCFGKVLFGSVVAVWTFEAYVVDGISAFVVVDGSVGVVAGVDAGDAGFVVVAVVVASSDGVGQRSKCAAIAGEWVAVVVAAADVGGNATLGGCCWFAWGWAAEVEVDAAAAVAVV